MGIDYLERTIEQMIEFEVPEPRYDYQVRPVAEGSGAILAALSSLRQELKRKRKGYTRNQETCYYE